MFKDFFKFLKITINKQKDPLVTFENSEEAFAWAIKNGKLSADSSDSKYAGNFMYMQTVNGEHRFKNILTREYLN